MFGSTVGVAPEAALIGKKLIKRLPTLEPVPVESLWQDGGSCVIIFFRRWGCLFSRQAAAEISALAPVLKANRVKLVGIGFQDEEQRWKGFLESNVFAGELYVDPNRETYAALGMKRLPIVTFCCNIFNPKAMAKVRLEMFDVTVVGDPLQNGGCIVVTNGGHDVPLVFREQNQAIHVNKQDVLRALNISDPVTKEPK